MINDKAICTKITECFNVLEHATKTKHLDLKRITELLHGARQDAQNMENALRWRKEAMEEAGIEEAYKAKKENRQITPGINKIANKLKETKIVDKRAKYEFTVKQDGEIIYQAQTYAGVFAAVERFDDIDKNGDVTGQSQQFYVGHPLLLFYAFNQLEKGLEDYKLPMMLAFKDAMEGRDDVSPEVKQALRGAANLLK